MQTCCPKKCFLNISLEKQKKTFTNFWKCGDYQAGNILLSQTLEKKNSEQDYKRSQWKFVFRVENLHFDVCRKFICNVFGVGERRIRTIQKIIMNEESFHDTRGTHGNQIVKLTEDVKTLIYEHCICSPHSQSHYGLEHTKLNYFKDPTITLHSLYYSFVDFYASVTGDTVIPIDESTYSKYFNHYVNFSFGVPRTDVCDVCYAYERHGEKKDIYDYHKLQIEQYKEIKKSMLATPNALNSEFDFGQNLPLPKIPVNSQFFLRLLWLYIFNVHIHGTERSYMIHFMEGSLKKGANTVCNLVYHVIKKEIELNYYDKIFLYSDAAGGQNRNYLSMQFFSIVSVVLQLEIQHLFPVRGHSYCQCDRNFGLYGSKKKMQERIETEEDYVEIIKTSRDPPFEVIDANKCKVADFESHLKADKELQKIKIRKVVKIVYFPNGQADLYYSYNEKPTTIRLEKSIALENLPNAPLASGVGVTKEKLKDVGNLLQFCTSAGQNYYKKFFETTTIKTKVTKEAKAEKKPIEKKKVNKEAKAEKTPIEKKKGQKRKQKKENIENIVKKKKTKK